MTCNNSNSKAIILALIAFITLCIIVCKADYEYTVVAEMDETTYEQALKELAATGNTDPSNSDIVAWYENR